MKIKQLEKVLKEMNIDPRTISFFVDEKGNDQDDTFFGTCDITGVQGMLVGCRACSTVPGARIVYFEVLESLVGGSLGKLAGAF